MQAALHAVLLGGVIVFASGSAADAVAPVSLLLLRSPAPGVLKGPHRDAPGEAEGACHCGLGPEWL